MTYTQASAKRDEAVARTERAFDALAPSLAGFPDEIIASMRESIGITLVVVRDPATSEFDVTARGFLS